MNFLDRLSDDQRVNIVSLPYRVGLWVSESDQTGGEEADARETEALYNILNGYSQEVFGSETVQHIIHETVSNQEQWDSWAKNLKDIEEDCRIAVDVLYHTVDPKEVNAFKKHLIEVGESVAMAFREYNRRPSLGVYITYYLGRLKASLAKKPYKTLNQFLNISMAERKTLSKLARSLGMTYI